MKRLVTLIATAFAMTGVFAQTNENFNSRPGTELTQVKNFLQSHCWQFHDFSINNGWDPAMEGDGAMVSGTTASSAQTAGIYSPLLSMGGDIRVSFRYKFSAAVTDRRWLKVYEAGSSNQEIKLLDSIELTGANNSSTYVYDKQLTGLGSGCHKIYINYQGTEGDNRIAIDQLSLGAPTCYSGGCNQAPVAEDDFVGGTPNFTAAGNVLPNDHDPENDVMGVQLVTNSADGDVVLQSYGGFTFTPKPGFKGQTTSFTYMACDNGSPSLCSDIATVNIVFQNALPVTITDLGALYANDQVNVKWTTTFELNNDHFEVERSFDGNSFKTVASIKGQGNSALRHNYTFSDDISKNVLNKNDVFYRLKQVDLDGKASYTKVLIVRVYRTKSLQSLSVTPNPAINDIKVNVQLNENSFIVMKVANSTGMELMRKTTRGSAGTNSFSLEGTSRLQPGIYFLEVIVNSNERMNIKLIKN